MPAAKCSATIPIRSLSCTRPVCLVGGGLCTRVCCAVPEYISGSSRPRLRHPTVGLSVGTACAGRICLSTQYRSSCAPHVPVPQTLKGIRSSRRTPNQVRPARAAQGGTWLRRPIYTRLSRKIPSAQSYAGLEHCFRTSFPRRSLRRLPNTSSPSRPN